MNPSDYLRYGHVYKKFSIHRLYAYAFHSVHELMHNMSLKSTNDFYQFMCHMHTNVKSSDKKVLNISLFFPINKVSQLSQ